MIEKTDIIIEITLPPMLIIADDIDLLDESIVNTLLKTLVKMLHTILGAPFNLSYLIGASLIASNKSKNIVIDGAQTKQKVFTKLTGTLVDAVNKLDKSDPNALQVTKDGTIVFKLKDKSILKFKYDKKNGKAIIVRISTSKEQPISQRYDIENIQKALMFLPEKQAEKLKLKIYGVNYRFINHDKKKLATVSVNNVFSRLYDFLTQAIKNNNPNISISQLQKPSLKSRIIQKGTAIAQQQAQQAQQTQQAQQAKQVQTKKQFILRVGSNTFTVNNLEKRIPTNKDPSFLKDVLKSIDNIIKSVRDSDVKQRLAFLRTQARKRLSAIQQSKQLKATANTKVKKQQNNMERNSDKQEQSQTISLFDKIIFGSRNLLTSSNNKKKLEAQLASLEKLYKSGRLNQDKQSQLEKLINDYKSKINGLEPGGNKNK